MLPQGYGVLGMRQGEPEEWEGQPALALTLAHLPGVSLSTFHVPPGGLPDAGGRPSVVRSSGAVVALGTEFRCLLDGPLCLPPEVAVYSAEV